MTKKKEKIPEQQPVYRVENCVITNTTAPTNEHTRDAVVALAEAVKANANALAEIARALKGGDARMDAAIRIGE